MNTKFYVVIAIAENEVCPTGPEIIAVDNFQEMQDRADRNTGGNGSYHIIAEITDDLTVIPRTEKN